MPSPALPADVAHLIQSDIKRMLDEGAGVSDLLIDVNANLGTVITIADAKICELEIQLQHIAECGCQECRDVCPSVASNLGYMHSVRARLVDAATAAADLIEGFPLPETQALNAYVACVVDKAEREHLTRSLKQEGSDG